MALPYDVKKHFKKDNKGYCKLLEALWETLIRKNYFGEALGPYPANHGEKHTKTVLNRIADLIDSFVDMNHWEKFEIFAAAMIHDLGMHKLFSEGAYSERGKDFRDNHANFDVISAVSTIPLERLTFENGDDLASEEIHRIMLIASGHAGDADKTAKRKQEDADKDKSYGKHLVRGMRVLRLADYLDLGKDRLATTWKEHDWRDIQLRHLTQHNVVTIGRPVSRCIVVKSICNGKGINFSFGKKDADDKRPHLISVSPIEELALLRTIHEKLRPIFDDYNKLTDNDQKWQLEPLDERLFGVVWPRVSGLGLFNGVLKRELEKNHLIPIDLMGHSLFGRFAQNEEGLNDLLQDMLSQGRIKLRILLLDPHIENQQMCEVYDAQRKLDSEKERSILPSYYGNGQVNDMGDILKSLDKLKKDWKEKVAPGSSLEVRLTSRLMYMNLSRFGDTIIATPYSGSGLFNSSIGLLHGKESVLNKAYTEEFESTWKNNWETRLYMYVGPGKGIEYPIMRLIPSWLDRNQEHHPLNYERYFLQNYMDRVIAVFKHVKSTENPSSAVVVDIPPPVEVEIQPSSTCNLRCWHCIGKNLPHRHEEANVFMSPGQADALLAWQAEGFSVERFRLSGLLGDPLHEKTIEFTLDFLEKAKKMDKHTVLFTNGFGIKESDFKRLLSADNIHVSLDAEKAATFENMKGASEADFQRITKNLRSICAELAKPDNSEKKIGIGFVVNETNVSEVNEAIKFAKRTGASFIRFKPDIRPTRAIPWRTWREAEQKIAKAQEQDNDGLDIVMTNVAWQHSRVPTSERCWAQYFFASIAPTGKIHVCDHLTESNGETSIGDLHSGVDINKLWTDAIKSKKFGKRTAHCQLCPPFNWHINRLLDQLFVLYEQYEGEKLRAWVSEALENSGRD